MFKHGIARKQLFSLFACSLVGWTILQGILNLLPVYSAQLGADSALSGNFLAFAFLALSTGTLAAGWLSTRFQRHKSSLIFIGLVNIPVTWLMGQAEYLWQFSILAAVHYFLIGLGFTTIIILAGLFAGATEKGKVFGILAINSSLGALIGGTASGPIVDRWGYPTLFLLASLCWVLQPLIALFLQDGAVSAVQHEIKSALPPKPAPGKAFFLFMLANLIAFGASFIAVLGRPLLMDRLQFDATAISGVVAFGGAVSLPLPFLFGWLSDRINRFWLMGFCFIGSAVGLFVLAESLSLWHFGASAILLSGVGISMGIGPALVTDLVHPRNLVHNQETFSEMER